MKLPVFNIERFAIHDGEGIRTAVFVQGCPLHCPWCANPESQQVGKKLLFLEKKCVGCGTCQRKCPHEAIRVMDGKASIDRARCQCCGTCAGACPVQALQMSGKDMTPEEIFEVVRRDVAYYRQTHGGLTLSGGEALLWTQALLPLLQRCRENGIPVDFETCGHVPLERVQEAFPYTDTFLFDVKSANEKRFHEVTGGDLALVLRNLSWICCQDAGRVVARVPVIPGFNADEQEMAGIIRVCQDLGIARMDLLPYHTLGMTKYAQMGVPYPYPIAHGMKKEEVLPYARMAEDAGLTVRIGG